MPPKRPAAASQSPSTSQARASGEGSSSCNNPDDFTRVVKKRLSSSTRTGQACDRCKVRKIRCDGLPGGCSPCIQNRTECKTTDRISQKAVPRGYLENLEAKCAQLEAKNKELQAALASMELDARSGAGYMTPQVNTWPTSKHIPNPNNPVERWPTAERPPIRQMSYTVGNSSTPSVSSEKSGLSAKTASFRPANSSSHYLGMSANNSYLSSMKAMALSILGIDIDLSVLDPGESATLEGGGRIDDSCGSFLATVLNMNPQVRKMELPPKDEGFQCVNYFFTVSHPYLPILHKPSFLKMLERMYTDKTFEPSPAQTVAVHMILAIVHYQNFVNDRMRNRGHTNPAAKDTMERSHLHYHYAISMCYELLINPTLEDLQALGLVLQHLRAFPKPGCSWLVSRLAMSVCMELGLHRSVKKLAYTGTQQNYIELELRKRVFWCIYTLDVSLAAKLGRPMSVRDTDIDIELPERIDDEYIAESGILKKEDAGEECAFDIAIEMFKHAPICAEIHGVLYATIRPSRDKYVTIVEDIENKLKKWKDNNPKSFSLESPRIERRFQAAHLHTWFHESQILLRHPSLSLSPSPSFTSDCIRICVESSRAILRLTDNLRKGNHYLDTTWYGASVQILATLTILFSVWDKRDNVSLEEVAQVKNDMDLCMDIMGDLGALLGSPNRLREVVQMLTHGTMELLNRKSDHAGRRSPRMSARGNSSASSLSSFSTTPTNYVNGPTALPIPNAKISANPQSSNEQYPAQIFSTHQSNNPTISNYNEPLVPSSENNLFESSVGIASSAASLYSNAFSPPAPHPPFPSSSEPSQSSMFAWGWSGNESWREYMQSISTIAGELDPSETYSASALIALNQDCNNGLFNGDGSAASGAPAVASLGLIGPNVSPEGSAPSNVSGGHNGFSPSESGNASWDVPMNGYNYSDGTLRGVRSNGATG